MSKLLIVEGKNFCAAASFELKDGEWKIWDMAPILKAILKGCAIKEIPKVLERKGLKWHWN